MREAQKDFELSTYEPVRVAVAPVRVTDEMVEAQLAREMARFARFEPAPGPAEEGESLRVNMHVAVNGVPEKALCGEGMTVALSRDMEPAGFVEGVAGMRTGERRSFDFTAHDQVNPGNPPDAFHVDIELLDKRRRVVPDLTDEFVRTRLSAQDATVAQFTERVRAYLADQQRREDEQRREQLACAELSRRLADALPDELIEQTRDDIMESLVADVAASGMTIAQFAEQQGMTERQLQMTILAQARESLRQGFALDVLYRHLGTPIDEAARARALAELAPGHEDEARTRCDERDGWEIVDVMARRLVAKDWLMKTAVFEETAGAGVR